MPENIDPSGPSGESSEHDFTELLESIKTPAVKAKAVRQGLPSQYRMRHDAHYVEELATRNGEAAAELPVAPETISMPAALRDLCQEFEGLASCFNLIEHGARPLRERIGLSLAKIGVQRSIRYAQQLRNLLEDPHPSYREVRLDEEIRQAFEDLKDELRLTESALVMDIPVSPLLLRADAALARIAIRACASTAISLIEMGGAAAELHVSAFAAADMVHCEFRQDAYEMDPEQIADLFHISSSGRAAHGRAVAVALQAAKRIAQLHGGQLHAKRTDLGGSLFLLSFPKLGGTSPSVSSIS
jgi:signal transduction histidine kinase